MKTYRLGNMDISLIITEEELSLSESLTEEGIIATSKIKSQSHDPLNNKEIQLIYKPECNVDGLDGRNVIRHLNNPPIPVYIGDRGIIRLQQRELCCGAYSFAKIEARVQDFARLY